tara:strand:- start:8703 stop:11603 length:2901 start_codon:yes stop_codon:yes gene_type:complete
MPKKTFTINGFPGGINTKKNVSDLDHDTDKAECAQAQGCVLGEGGINDHKPLARPSVGVAFPEGIDHTANKFVVVPDENGNLMGYSEKGVYAHGEDVNWSGNGDYRIFPPTEGMVNDFDYNGGSHNWGIDLQIYPTRDNDRLIILGSKSEQYPQVNFVGQQNRPGKICDQTVLGDGTTSGARAPDDFLITTHGGNESGMDVLGAGRTHWDMPNTGGTDYHFHIDASVSQNQMDALARDANWTYINLDEGTNSVDINQRNPNKSFDAFSFFRHNPVESTKMSGGLTIRAGKVDSTADTIQDNGLYGFSAPTLEDRYIHLEYRILQDDVGFQGFRILADCNDADNRINWDTNPIDSYAKAWDFNLGELENGVGEDAYWGTVTKKWTESIHTGASFSPGNVKMFWIVPMFSGYVDAGGSNPVVEIRELSFIKPPDASNLWGNRKYSFYQSAIKNGVESLLSRYDCKIYGQNVGGGVNIPYYQTVYNSLNFSFIIPSAGSIDQGKIYYRECNDHGDAYGEHFLLAEWDYRGSNIKYKFADGEWITYTAGSVSTTPVNVHSPPKGTTFELETGYPDGTEDINAEWKASAIIGSQVYIGNVKGTLDGQWRGSKILKTTNGRHAGFSDKDFIDLDLQGDEIQVMESSGDRLFVFGKKDLYVVNVAQDIEYIEATLPGMGISNYCQVTKVDEGLAFINASGVYFFDGQGTLDITDAKLGPKMYTYGYSNQVDDTATEPVLDNDGNWGGYAQFEVAINADEASIYYEPNENNLIVCIDTDDFLVYNLRRKVWTCHLKGSNSQNLTYPVKNSTANSVIIKGNENLSPGQEPGISAFYVPKNETSSAFFLDYQTISYGSLHHQHGKAVKFLTGDISCGDINRRKKFYYLYLNTKNWTTTQKLNVYFTTDRGKSWYQATNENSTTYNYIDNGENKFNIKSSGKSINIMLMSPFLNTASWPSEGIIDDMSIVYRERTVK